MPKTVTRTVAEFIADRLATIDKTQRQVAAECGLEHPNVISMFKTGATKLPLSRIGPLARALDVDPAYLLRLVMLEYFPDTWESIENVIQSTVLTANELGMVQAFRAINGGSDAKAVLIDECAVVVVVANRTEHVARRPW